MKSNATNQRESKPRGKGEAVGRPRKFKTLKDLQAAWEAYEKHCNNRSVLTHEFSAKSSEFVSKKLKRSVTYTIEGFCLYAGISRQSFYEHYANNPQFTDMVTCAREACEVDAREKFELGMIPMRLAGLWMSHYGYSTKTNNKVAADIPVVICDDLLLED